MSGGRRCEVSTFLRIEHVCGNKGIVVHALEVKRNESGSIVLTVVLRASAVMLGAR